MGAQLGPSWSQLAWVRPKLGPRTAKFDPSGLPRARFFPDCPIHWQTGRGWYSSRSDSNVVKSWEIKTLSAAANWRSSSPKRGSSDSMRTGWKIGRSTCWKTMNNEYLVGGFNPSEKILVSWDYEIPNIWKVIKFMFQTTRNLRKSPVARTRRTEYHGSLDVNLRTLGMPCILKPGKIAVRESKANG